MSKPGTHGRQLIAHLKRKPHTYLEMLRYGISVAPWMRVLESLRPDEQIKKGRDSRNRITWKVVSIPLADRA
jgi:hypothetical protein